jgi:hypothetical protein
MVFEILVIKYNKYCIIPLLLFEIIIGIFEAIYLDKYVNYIYECANIWPFIFVACIVDIFLPVLYGLRYLLNCCFADEIDRKIKILHTLNLLISLWSFILLITINNSCQTFWIIKSPEIWTFVKIHFVLFCLYASVIILYTIYYIEKCAIFMNNYLNHYDDEILLNERITTITIDSNTSKTDTNMTE